MTMIITTPDMEMDMAMANASTVTLTHSADPDGAGISVSGTVSDYSSSMSSSMFGDMPTGEATVSGELEFVLGPLGDVEMVSTPEVSQADGMPVIPYLLNTDVLFPRFPEHPLRVGDTWADTTTSSADLDDAAAGLTGTVTGTAITAFTLVGDTVVDGKTYQKITLSGLSEGETTAEDPGGGSRGGCRHHHQHPGGVLPLGRRPRTGRLRGADAHPGGIDDDDGRAVGHDRGGAVEGAAGELTRVAWMVRAKRIVCKRREFL